MRALVDGFVYSSSHNVWRVLDKHPTKTLSNDLQTSSCKMSISIARIMHHMLIFRLLRQAEPTLQGPRGCQRQASRRCAHPSSSPRPASPECPRRTLAPTSLCCRSTLTRAPCGSTSTPLSSSLPPFISDELVGAGLVLGVCLPQAADVQMHSLCIGAVEYGGPDWLYG